MSKLSVPAVSVFLALVGCKDPDTKEVDDEECTPLPGEPGAPCDPETGGDETAGDETAGDETVADEASDPTELGPDACVHNVTDEFVGYRMQCEGKLYTRTQFKLPFGNNCESTLAPDICSQYHVFGPSNDTYEAPDVMACCGEAWDHQYSDTYLKYCTYDLIQQVCISLAKRLEGYIHDGAFGNHAGQAAALQIWIAENYKECFEALRQNDSNPEPDAIESFWKVPNNSAWSSIDDMVLHIDSGTEVTGVFRPESPLDWISCSGVNGNNDEIFKDMTRPNGGIVAGVDLTSNVFGELVGPAIFGGTVTASTVFETSCVPHGCPAAMFSYDVGEPTLTLEGLTLYTGPFVVTNGVGWLTVERARIELWGQAEGIPKHDLDGQFRGYEIPAGEAQFLLSGASDGHHSQFIGANATHIEISLVEESWLVRSFVIEYEDGSGRDWALTLGESEWQ